MASVACNCMMNPMYELLAFHITVQEAVNVAHLVSSCEQVEEFPHIDVAQVIPAEALVTVIIFHHKVHVAIGQWERRQFFFVLQWHILVKPCPSNNLCKL